MANSGGNASRSYFPYGSELNSNGLPAGRQGQIPNSKIDKLFTGHRKLDGVSVYHAGARYYSPLLGMFIQPDRVEGPNRYEYVENNPVRINDPGGTCGIPCFFMLAGILGGMSTGPMSSQSAPEYFGPAGGPDSIGGTFTPSDAEFNLALWRLNPVFSIPAATYETVTKRNLASQRSLSRVENVFNVVELATMGTVATDYTAGSINSLYQQSRVARYPGGAELLAANSTHEAEGLLSQQIPNLNFIIRREEHVATTGIKGFYYANSRTIHYPKDDLKILQHEGVHALQHLNNHPAFLAKVPKTVDAFDAEMMAYSTGSGMRSYVRQTAYTNRSIYDSYSVWQPHVRYYLQFERQLANAQQKAWMPLIFASGSRLTKEMISSE